jgi:DNA-binding NarL/FixJ family response regulator
VAGALRPRVAGLPPVLDGFIVHALCPSGLGVATGVLVPRRIDLPLAIRRQWARIARHIAAAARLRVHARVPELVMNAEGAALHADGAAKERDARAALRAAARAIDRVRGRRIVDADAALSMWRVLTESRWTIADRFEENGRRYVVAYANEPEPTAATTFALTRREAHVAALAVFGHSNKEIAYELGLAPSTVASHLASAMKRLRVRNRVQLAHRFRGVARA